MENKLLQEAQERTRQWIRGEYVFPSYPEPIPQAGIIVYCAKRISPMCIGEIWGRTKHRGDASCFVCKNYMRKMVGLRQFQENQKNQEHQENHLSTLPTLENGGRVQI